jgi:hypothetical protein
MESTPIPASTSLPIHARLNEFYPPLSVGDNVSHREDTEYSFDGTVVARDTVYGRDYYEVNWEREGSECYGRMDLVGRNDPEATPEFEQYIAVQRIESARATITECSAGVEQAQRGHLEAIATVVELEAEYREQYSGAEASA